MVTRDEKRLEEWTETSTTGKSVTKQKQALQGEWTLRTEKER